MPQRAILQYGTPSRGRNALTKPPSGKEVEQVCAITDPFCPAAAGAKLPDADSARSIGLGLREKIILSTNASGVGVLSINPSLLHLYRTATTITGTVITTFSANVAISSNTAIASACSAYRVVSWGVRIFPIIAPTNQSGTVRVITTAESPGSGYETAGNLHSQYQDFALATPEVLWTAKDKGVQSREYVDIASTRGTLPWEEVVIFVQGAAASSDVLAVEVYLNIEATVNLGAMTTALTTPATPERPHVMTARSHLKESFSGVFMGSVKQFGNMVVNSAKHALVDAASALLPAGLNIVARGIGNYITGNGGRVPKRRRIRGAPPMEVD